MPAKVCVVEKVLKADMAPVIMALVLRMEPAPKCKEQKDADTKAVNSKQEILI